MSDRPNELASVAHLQESDLVDEFIAEYETEGELIAEHKEVERLNRYKGPIFLLGLLAFFVVGSMTDLDAVLSSQPLPIQVAWVLIGSIIFGSFLMWSSPVGVRSQPSVDDEALFFHYVAVAIQTFRDDPEQTDPIVECISTAGDHLHPEFIEGVSTTVATECADYIEQIETASDPRQAISDTFPEFALIIANHTQRAHGNRWERLKTRIERDPATDIDARGRAVGELREVLQLLGTGFPGVLILTSISGLFVWTWYNLNVALAFVGVALSVYSIGQQKSTE